MMLSFIKHMTGRDTVAAFPLYLGLAGLLPQIGVLAALLQGNAEWKSTALIFGHAYAALIFSFLGGMWWGLAAGSIARGQAVPNWLWGAAVAPSLIAGATYLPWAFGKEWLGVSLCVLGISIAASPLIDQRLNQLTPGWWMSLRWTLSLGLGVLTLVIALLT
jgi:hypothetical protein